MQTPILVPTPSAESNLEVFETNLRTSAGKTRQGFLIMSPEYSIKKLLAAGIGNCFEITKCFRNEEEISPAHNPEFTMLEWYRVGADYKKIMEDMEGLVGFVENGLMTEDLGFRTSVEFWRVSMRDLWEKFVRVDLDEYLTSEAMLGLCVERKYNVKEDESYEDLFYRIFLNEIEPKLADMGAMIIYDYPAQMAALSRLSGSDPRYAERFEVYINGMELANAFSELTDAGEQLRRLKDEQKLRKKLGKEIYDIDKEFISAVGQMPKSAGIAFMGTQAPLQRPF